MKNLTLAKDIERELLEGEESQRIRNAVTLEKEGIIEFFVRDGRHQITTLPPVGVLIIDSEKRFLDLNSYEDMVKSVSEAIKKSDRIIDYGNIILSYRANEKGELELLNLQYKSDIKHVPPKRRRIAE